MCTTKMLISGFWYMHCHMEYHNTEGMGLVFQVGEPEQMNPPPVNMRTCGDFYWSSEEFIQRVTHPGLLTGKSNYY